MGSVQAGHAGAGAAGAAVTITPTTTVTSRAPALRCLRFLPPPCAQPIRGFIAAVFPGSSAPSSFGNAKAGALTPTDAKAQVQAQCAGGVTHVSNADKSSITWNWTPPAGGGTVTAHAIVVYQLDQYTTLDLTVPQASPTPTRTKSASRSRTRTASRTRSRTASATRKIKL